MFVLWIAYILQVFITVKCKKTPIVTTTTSKPNVIETTTVVTASVRPVPTVPSNQPVYRLPYADLLKIVIHVRNLLAQMDQKIELHRGRIAKKKIIPPDVRTNTNMIDSEIKETTLSMIIFRREQHAGYCIATLAGIVDAIVDNQGLNLRVLIDTLKKTVQLMLTSGELAILGIFLINRVKSYSLWTAGLSATTLKETARHVQAALSNLDADLLNIFTEYDTLFTREEGEILLDKVKELYTLKDTAIFTDPRRVEELIKSIIDAFLTPANNMHYTFALRNLLNNINKAYQRSYFGFRRSNIRRMNNTTKYQRNDISKTTSLRQNYHRKGLESTQLMRPPIRTDFDNSSNTNVKRHNKNEHYYRIQMSSTARHRPSIATTGRSKSRSGHHTRKKERQPIQKSQIVTFEYRKRYKSLQRRSSLKRQHRITNVMNQNRQYNSYKIRRNDAVLRQIDEDSSYRYKDSSMKAMLNKALRQCNQSSS